MPSWGARAAAAGAAGALVLCALAGLLPHSSLPALAAAGAAALLVALLPGGGWIVAAAATLAALTFSTEPRVGAALIVLLAVALPPLALRAAPLAWSAPAAAPALGLLGLAGAFPALAGTARSAWTRAALGVTGLWWLLLAEPLLGRDLLFGLGADLPARPHWDGAASLTASEIVGPLVTSGALLQAVVWGAGAARHAMAGPRPLAVGRRGRRDRLGGRPGGRHRVARGGRRRLDPERTGCGSTRCGHPRRGLAMAVRHDRGT